MCLRGERRGPPPLPPLAPPLPSPPKLCLSFQALPVCSQSSYSSAPLTPTTFSKAVLDLLPFFCVQLHSLIRMSTDPVFNKMQDKIQMAKEMSEDKKLYRYKGVLYPTLMCPEEHMTALDNLKAREDDLMLVAYPKCGFNWMVGVLKKIIAEATGEKNERKTPPLIEFFGPEVVKMMEELPSPRFLGTHLYPDNIPPSFYEKKTKIMVIFRNPKDTLVSYYHFCNNNPVLPTVSWESFFSQFMKGEVAWGSYFDHALAWDKKMDDPNVMIVTYEDLKQDLKAGVHQISNFFGFTLTEVQVQQIAEKSTFNAMKENSGQSHGNIGNVFFRKGDYTLNLMLFD
uniref:Sulfotransferase n=1 Tax=Oryzias latipes TaxID=8090 RepID=A0A3P9H9M8_ORYLA